MTAFIDEKKAEWQYMSAETKSGYMASVLMGWYLEGGSDHDIYWCDKDDNARVRVDEWDPTTNLQQAAQVLDTFGPAWVFQCHRQSNCGEYTWEAVLFSPDLEKTRTFVANGKSECDVRCQVLFLAHESTTRNKPGLSQRRNND